MPAEARLASFGMVLRGDVAGGDKVGVQLVTAVQAAEDRLLRPIALVDVAALWTGP
jgi:hypothetical protein